MSAHKKINNMTNLTNIPPLSSFSGCNILLLQGPVGPFFHRFMQDLTKNGAHVFKINFNGGDDIFFPNHAIRFKGTMDEWPDFLENIINKLNIEKIFLYNDTRPIHDHAIEIAKKKNLDFFTFEEGYLRPDYVTLECGRCNGHSKIPRNPDFYLSFPSAEEHPASFRPVGYTFYHLMLWGGLYHFAISALSPLHPSYTYHRGQGIAEFPYQIRSLLRRQKALIMERGLVERLLGPLAGRFFFVPLQVAIDSQVLRHSPFGRHGEKGVARFIETVLRSFAEHAPKDHVLVFKHHPMDRGYVHYGALIETLVRETGLKGRVYYTHMLPLPPLLEKAAGTVVINSTVGLSAIYHGSPVKVLGDAIYDMPGLTAQSDLDTFWTTAMDQKPNADLALRFRSYLIRTRQINGSFYRRLPDSPLACGLNWPA